MTSLTSGGVRVIDHKSHLGSYAGFVSRSAAYIIDFIILAVLIAFVLFLIDSSLAYLFPSSGVIATSIPWLNTVVQFIESPTFGRLTGLLLIMGYYVFFWWAAGQTPGKAILGVKIVRMNGKRLSVYRSFIRLVGYVIDFITLGLGFIWILVDDRRQGFHDKLARTYVIYTWNAQPDEMFLSVALRRLRAIRMRAAKIARRDK